jgi:deoxyribonuclease-1
VKVAQAVIVLSLALVPALALGDPPPRPFGTFEAAKKAARNSIFADHRVDFYCGCAWVPMPDNLTTSGGRIDATACGYTPRKNAKRGAILEWEHVVPAAFFGQHRACWRKGHEKCVNSKGVAFKGRACCAKVDRTFRRIEADLHNLWPSVGELNGDRSNLPYGIVDGEPRLYGACDFEIGGKPRVTEPRDEVRGDAARIWLYMADTYKIKITAARRKMFYDWSAADPVDDFERLRDTRIDAAQGNRNPFVK